jgi:hypothetical protein
MAIIKYIKLSDLFDSVKLGVETLLEMGAIESEDCDRTCVHYIYNVIRKTGQFDPACFKWKALPPDDINSLLVIETHDTIFSKKTSNIFGDNGSSLNIPITIKIIAFTNITLLETSVLVVYLLLYYLNLKSSSLIHLLWQFEICLPSLYNLIEFSPNDQNTPKLFVPISVPISIFRLISMY